MQLLNLQQTADYLEAATIEDTIEAGHAVIHIGRTEAGAKFVLVNDHAGMTAVTEGL